MAATATPPQRPQARLPPLDLADRQLYSRLRQMCGGGAR